MPCTHSPLLAHSLPVIVVYLFSEPSASSQDSSLSLELTPCLARASSLEFQPNTLEPRPYPGVGCGRAGPLRSDNSTHLQTGKAVRIMTAESNACASSTPLHREVSHLLLGCESLVGERDGPRVPCLSVSELYLLLSCLLKLLIWISSIRSSR